MHADYPGVSIVGSSTATSGPTEEEAIGAPHRGQARPDVLFVAMTSPKKENFLARWSGLMDVPVCHGVGAPSTWSRARWSVRPILARLGLEWLYRVKQEPRRLWRRYLVTNTLFCAMVLGQLLRRFWPTR